MYGGVPWCIRLISARNRKCFYVHWFTRLIDKEQLRKLCKNLVIMQIILFLPFVIDLVLQRRIAKECTMHNFESLVTFY